MKKFLYLIVGIIISIVSKGKEFIDIGEGSIEQYKMYKKFERMDQDSKGA